MIYLVIWGCTIAICYFAPQYLLYLIGAGIIIFIIAGIGGGGSGGGSGGYRRNYRRNYYRRRRW